MKHEKVEDVLKHYGVKGMKWDKNKLNVEVDADTMDSIRNTQNNIKENLDKTGLDLQNLQNSPAFKTVNAIRKVGDSIKDKVSSIGKGGSSITSKVKSISEDVKKKGYDILLKMFGPAKNKRTITTYIESPNRRR